MDKLRLAFIRVFAGPPIARSVEQMLIETFPGFEVETITLTELLKRRPDLLFLNGLATLREYGLEIMSGKRQFRRAFMVTPFLFRQVRRLVREYFAGREHEFTFSFQLQSLFDTSTQFFPHYVYTDHTNLANLSYTAFEGAPIHSPSWLKLEKEVYLHADHIFTRSNNITQSLQQQYDVPASKITTAYVGVNAQVVDGGLRNDRYRNQRVLFVGTEWERKGGPELVAAFNEVRQRFPEAHLTIVGCEPDLDVPNCEVLGRLPLAQLADYYRSASVFCLPTKREPFGVAFIEAMAYKLPVIGTDLGAIPDFVLPGETGLLVPANDVSALADALASVLGDPEMARQMGENGCRLAQARYNWRQVGQAIRQVILPVATGARSLPHSAVV